MLFLKVTNKQMYFIQSYVYDMCNLSLNENYTENQLKVFDGYDVYRIKIHQKERKLNKSYYVFDDLTKGELKFIRQEIEYFMFDGFERDQKEKQMAKRLLTNISNTLDTQYNRNLILNEILK